VTVVAASAERIVASHRRTERRRRIWLLGLALAALAAFVLDVITGPSTLTTFQLLQGLVSPETLSRAGRVIVFDVRLPQACTAVLVGAALALAGAEMQVILDNPLASPFTLGISSAASLGAALGIVLGTGIPAVPPSWLVPANAFVFALAATGAIQLLARLRGPSTDTLVLFGIAVMFGANAGIALLQFTASAQTLQQLVFWTLGGLTRTDWPRLVILLFVVAAVAPFSLQAAGRFDALRLGEDRARAFGVDTHRLRLLSYLRVSLLTATAVAFVGTIAFVGLVGPHLARLLVGEGHRASLPAAMLAGALLLSTAAVAAKLILPGAVLPVGIVTSLVGVPIFLILIMSRRPGS
jgi:iron complex transport system permease protein